MKKKMLLLTALGLLAGAPMLVRAADTNAPAGNAEKAKPYPLNYCVVSGDKIGEMGKPVTNYYKGQQIIFCCPDCVKDFKKEPDKYLQKIQDAVTKGELEKK